MSDTRTLGDDARMVTDARRREVAEVVALVERWAAAEGDADR